jgi:hypothetical protein
MICFCIHPALHFAPRKYIHKCTRRARARTHTHTHTSKHIQMHMYALMTVIHVDITQTLAHAHTNQSILLRSVVPNQLTHSLSLSSRSSPHTHTLPTSGPAHRSSSSAFCAAHPPPSPSISPPPPLPCCLCPPLSERVGEREER